MLTSLQKVYDELAEIDPPEVQQSMKDWSQDLLDHVTDLLRFFGDATQQLEGDGPAAGRHVADDRHAFGALSGDTLFIRRLKVDLRQKLDPAAADFIFE